MPLQLKWCVRMTLTDFVQPSTDKGTTHPLASLIAKICESVILGDVGGGVHDKKSVGIVWRSVCKTVDQSEVKT